MSSRHGTVRGTLANSSGSAAYTIIVAQTIDFSGLSSLRAGFGNLQNGNPIKKTALAE